MPKAKKEIAVCTCMEPKKLGMFFGSLFALMHLGWAVLVASGLGQAYVNWILGLHMISMAVVIGPFSIVSTIGLLIVTFIIGYVMGWIIALVWNWVEKCKCCMC